MSADDLGKGDVVEAAKDIYVDADFTGPGWVYDIKAGQRAIVSEVRKAAGFCDSCGPRRDLVGFRLQEYPLAEHVLWCPCEWKKIGGGRADTIAKFAQHLAPASIARHDQRPAQYRQHRQRAQDHQDGSHVGPASQLRRHADRWDRPVGRPLPVRLRGEPLPLHQVSLEADRPRAVP